MVVTTQAELAALCERLSHAKAIAVDTEFASEDRYYAEVGVIQLGDDEIAAVVDPVAVKDLSPLKPLLSATGIVKILHAGDQDLKILNRLLKVTVAPVFDTQVAAALLGFGDQISLRNLLEATLRVSIEKSFTFTDWLRRPLSQNQLEYAKEDVRYLAPLHRVLSDRLAAKGRIEWVKEECRKLECAERYEPVDETQAYLRIGGVRGLNGAALGRLQALAAWREVTGRRLNRPAKKVLIDPVVVELAMRPPASVPQLLRVRGITRHVAEPLGAEILQVLKNAPSSAPRPVSFEARMPEKYEATVDFLSLCLRTLARELGMSAGIIATRSDLARLVMERDEAEVALLRGWRREAAGLTLLAALEGKASATIDARTREVRLT